LINHVGVDSIAYFRRPWIFFNPIDCFSSINDCSLCDLEQPILSSIYYLTFDHFLIPSIFLSNSLSLDSVYSFFFLDYFYYSLLSSYFIDTFYIISSIYYACWLDSFFTIFYSFSCLRNGNCLDFYFSLIGSIFDSAYYFPFVSFFRCYWFSPFYPSFYYSLNAFYLYCCNRFLIIPLWTSFRIIVFSFDVIHSLILGFIVLVLRLIVFQHVLI
jgi:hypothetical protein